MEPVGHARSARIAARRSAAESGWLCTKEYSPESAKVAGASWRHASQFMHVESTKKSPGAFCGSRFLGFAISPPSRETRHSTLLLQAPTRGMECNRCAGREQ